MSLSKNNVLEGSDGWLFLNGGNHHPFEYLQSKKYVNNLVKEAFVDNHLSRFDYCNRKKIKYSHVVFPSKPLVRRDKLPKTHNAIKPLFDEEYKLDGLEYPLEILKNIETSFFRTDTHTTPKGSFGIFQHLCKTHFENISFHADYSLRNKKGDLATMFGMTETEEYEEFIGLKNHTSAVIKFTNRAGLTGNTGQISYYRNALPVINSRVLVFGDSFFEDALNLQFAHAFKEVLYIRTQFFMYEIIDFYKPDFVLSGQAERYVPSTKSDANRPFPFIGLLNRNFYEQKNVDQKFELALSYVMQSQKDEAGYKKWCHDMDAFALMRKAKEVSTVSSEKALSLIRAARKLVPENEYLASLESQFLSISEE